MVGRAQGLILLELERPDASPGRSLLETGRGLSCGRVNEPLRSGCNAMRIQPRGSPMTSAFDLITPILGLIGATGYMGLIAFLLLRMVSA
jgi:hypothetical protein